MNAINSGKGWKKAVGGTLMGLAGLGTAGSFADDPVAAVLGGAVLAGVGTALWASDKKKKGSGCQSGCGTLKEVDKGIIKFMKKSMKTGNGLKLSGQGNSMNAPKIKAFMEKHKDKQIHIRDILGEDWKTKKEELKKLLVHAIEMRRQNQTGGNVFKDIKRGVDKAARSVGHKLTQFVDGKTKLTPSKLLSYVAGAVGVVGAASALIPGVDLISVPVAGAISLGLKGASTVLSTSGRGTSSVLSKKHHEYLMEEPEKSRMILKILKTEQSGAGLITKSVVGASGLALYAYLKQNPHLINEAAKALTTYMSGSGWDDFMDYSQLGIAGLEDPAKIGQAVTSLAQAAGPLLSKTKLGLAVGVTGAALAAVYTLYKKVRSSKGKGLELSGGGLALSGGSLDGKGLALSGGKNSMPSKIDTFLKTHPALSKKIAILSQKGKGYQSGSGTMSKILAAAGLVGTTAAGTAYAMYNYLLENPSVAAKIAAKGATKLILGSGPKYKKKKGKIVGTKSEVFNPNTPHQVTTGGLAACDLMKGKGNKIISKKRHMLGKELYAKNKDKLTPFRKS